MKLNRVLIVIKPDAVPIERLRGRMLKRLAGGSALDAAARALDEHGSEYHVALRDRIPRPEGFDLILPVGGDGTFLAAAHAADGVPLLGVNPAPRESVGFFCAATVKTLPQLLARIELGKLAPKSLPLIETRIDGKAMECLALNDVLFAGSSPAETVRCSIRAGGAEEFQKSSGIWIAAGPGSTAAIRSAGGKPQPIASCRLQYRVREPYHPLTGRVRLAGGILPAGKSLKMTSRMKGSAIYLDGHWHSYAVPMGSTVEVRIAKQTLKIYR